ncbi:TolC family protein [Verrucomicrobiales bacterium]|nr:TolC family protein [Verrucomicrobiales bacterium]
MPLFQGGNKKSTVAQSVAKWDEAAEKYRSALLTAVQEVDDSLLDVKVLKQQATTQQRALDSAAKATSLATKRFDQGAASYFEVVDAQRTELDVRRSANALASEQAAATVQLIQALGGEW